MSVPDQNPYSSYAQTFFVMELQLYQCITCMSANCKMKTPCGGSGRVWRCAGDCWTAIGRSDISAATHRFKTPDILSSK